MCDGGWPRPFCHAYKKGMEAFRAGKDRNDNPYKRDQLCGYRRSIVTFSRTWWRAWDEGWEAGYYGYGEE